MKFYDWLTILLIVVGIGFTVSGLFSNAGDQATFFVAYLAFVYALVSSIRSRSENSRLKKTSLVAGTSIESLQIEIDKELKLLKVKTIISVQVISNKSAIIVYTD